MRLFWLFSLAALWAAHGANAASPSCSAQLQADASVASMPLRDITRDDLVGLRDIGAPDQQVDQKMFSVSPDGAKLAFQLRRGDPVGNRHCLGIFVLDLKQGGAPTLVDESDEFLMVVVRTPEWEAASGLPNVVVPQWSPNSRSLLYLKRTGGVTQVWRATIGQPPAAASRSTVDVEAAAWVDDDRIVFFNWFGAPEALARIDREGVAGYLYGPKFYPVTSTKPQAPGGIERRFFTVDAAGAQKAATESERTILDAPRPGAAGAQGVWKFRLSEAERQPTGDDDPANLKTRSALRVKTEAWDATCQRVVCDATLGAWLDVRKDRVIFLKRPAWAVTGALIYAWGRGEAQPELLARSPRQLVGCDLVALGLICGEETPTQPRRLALVDLRTGGSKLLFDPNPEFAHIRFGQTKALRWINTFGAKATGTLVLPPSHKTGDRDPLIVVQYVNRGFLRGGTGDEYPVHLFAANGFAVLALNDPLPFSYRMPLDGQSSIERTSLAANRGWTERKNVQGSLEAGLRAVSDLGVADPARFGITGMSAGAQTLQWALVQSDFFAAAAVSDCCNDRYAPVIGSQLRLQHMRAINGGKNDISEADYDKVSLEHNVQTIRAPLLMQVADAELRAALPAYYNLQIAEKPVELYVYPGEFHTKWQPSHRAMIYQRNLDWFNFWLQNRIDPDPAKSEQYGRWRQLRDRARGDHRTDTVGPEGAAIRASDGAAPAFRP
jgi:dipeptidyl aminopeptidase/acylaminoacyl peptidase